MIDRFYGSVFHHESRNIQLILLICMSFFTCWQFKQKKLTQNKARLSSTFVIGRSSLFQYPIVVIDICCARAASNILGCCHVKVQLFVVSVSGIGFLKDQCRLSLIRKNARWKPFSNSILLQKLRNCKMNRLRVRRRAISIPLSLNLMHQGKAKVQKSLLVKHMPSLLLIKVLFSSLFFFMQSGKILFISIFHHAAAAFQGQHFPVLIANKSLLHPQVTDLPLSLYVCTCIKCMAVYLCNKYFELCR